MPFREGTRPKVPLFGEYSGYLLYLVFQYGNVGSMAVTLCQSLGQNIGMRWNNARSAAGISKFQVLKGTPHAFALSFASLETQSYL